MDIKWTKELTVNDERIDTEHQMYFSLLNNLSAEDEKGASKEKLIRLFNEFMLFTRFHFMTEENMMLDTNYNDYTKHRMAHSYALDTIKSKLFDFEQNKISCDEILDFAIEWFLMHVSEQDRQLGNHLASL